ncbi:MAG: ABC transporter ATP-binding protein [Lachnospiraceae bacterium]|nr:ABC transporter ATP-binding protein [Lachnospiraceae bacterium]
MYMKKYFLRHKLILSLWLLTVLSDTVANLIMAFFVQQSIDIALYKGLNALGKLSLFGLIYVICYFAAGYAQRYFQNLFAQKTMVDLRKDVFRKILGMSENEYEGKNQAHYLTVLTSDIKTAVSDYFCLYPSMISFAILTVASVAILFYFNWIIAVVDIVVSMLSYFTPFIFSKTIKKLYKKITTENEDLINTSKDFLQGFNEIKNYNAENEINSIYNSGSITLAKSEIAGVRTRALSASLSGALSWLVYIIHYLLSVFFVIKGDMTIAGMVAAAQVVMYIVNPLGAIGQLRTSIKSAEPAVSRIKDLLDMKQSSVEYKDIKAILPINVKNLTFSYDDNTVLKGINLKIELGKKYLIAGGSGSGKSTLMKVLNKYYSDYSGSILFNNTDSLEVDKRSLNNIISYVPQSAMLFNGSIKDNITMFSDFSDETVIKAAEKAELHSLGNNILNLKDIIEENGKNISGGEKQRIELARSFLRGKKVLMLDEATSNLDKITRFKVEERILDDESLTVIIISHNYDENTLKKYDRILYLSDGKICEQGTFSELMDKKGLFYSFYSLESIKES